MRNRLTTGLLVGAALAVVLTSAGALWANNHMSAAGRIVAVDVGKVFAEYQRQKDLSEEFKGKKDQLDRENQTRRGAIESLQAQVDRMDANRDPLFAAKMREVLQMQIEYKNWFDLNEADLAREVGVWTDKIYKEIVDGASDMAQREGIDLVVYKDEYRPQNYNVDTIRQQIANRKVLFASAASDVTMQLLDKLNAQYRAQPRTNMIQAGPTAAAPAPVTPSDKKP